MYESNLLWVFIVLIQSPCQMCNKTNPVPSFRVLKQWWVLRDWPTLILEKQWNKLIIAALLLLWCTAKPLGENTDIWYYIVNYMYLDHFSHAGV